MRFNTDRRNRLAFNAVAVDYMARPAIPVEVVEWCVASVGLERGDSVLEIGAGTGQLTGRLLDLGVAVTALEPGDQLASVLVDRFASNPRFAVERRLFEEFSPGRTFDSVWSANAFHWLDPERAYPLAHRVLSDHGSLVLLWTFLIHPDASLAAELRNERLGGRLANFLPEAPGAFIDDFKDSAEAGRDQLRRSGLFSEPRWTMVQAPLTVGAEQYPALLLSFANAAAAATDEREGVRADVSHELAKRGLETLNFEQYAYALVADAV